MVTELRKRADASFRKEERAKEAKQTAANRPGIPAQEGGRRGFAAAQATSARYASIADTYRRALVTQCTNFELGLVW
jgi:hypothetical protein